MAQCNEAMKSMSILFCFIGPTRCEISLFQNAASHHYILNITYLLTAMYDDNENEYVIKKKKKSHNAKYLNGPTNKFNFL